VVNFSLQRPRPTAGPVDHHFVRPSFSVYLCIFKLPWAFFCILSVNCNTRVNTMCLFFCARLFFVFFRSRGSPIVSSRHRRVGVPLYRASAFPPPGLLFPAGPLLVSSEFGVRRFLPRPWGFLTCSHSRYPLLGFPVRYTLLLKMAKRNPYGTPGRSRKVLVLFGGGPFPTFFLFGAAHPNFDVWGGSVGHVPFSVFFFVFVAFRLPTLVDTSSPHFALPAVGWECFSRRRSSCSRFSGTELGGPVVR